MRLFHRISWALLLIIVGTQTWAQSDIALARAEKVLLTEEEKSSPDQKVIVITGVRFAYPLIEQWIDEYAEVKPDVQLIIDARGSNDPLKYDILVEIQEPDEATRKSREYVYAARYAILPVATSNSDFAKHYAEKGLNKDLINQIFFHDIFADKEKQKKIEHPFTPYTRIQKAGVPILFAKHFGYEQKDIKGNGVAGSDAHLVKALLRDSIGVTYLPLSLIYDRTTGKPIDGLTVLPVDLNGNNKVSDEEKFYGTLQDVINQIENAKASNLKNIPVGYLHLSVNKETADPAAVDFLNWVNVNREKSLHEFGFFKVEENQSENQKFGAFAERKGTQGR